MSSKIRQQIERRRREVARRLDKNDNRGCDRPIMTASNIHYEIADRTRATAAGGIGAMHLLARKLGLVESIDRHLGLLKFYFPYHDSDHVLNIAYHPLIISLANTGEPLFVVNRSGNRPSHEQAAAYFDRSIALCREAGFKKIRLRGDTDFTQTKDLDRWDADGVTFVFGIDATDNGNTTTNVYDLAGRKIAVQNALGYRVTTAYDGADRVIAVTDPRNNTQQMSYDRAGRMLTKSDGLNRVTSYLYDNMGNRTYEKDARGIITSMTYVKGADDVYRLTGEQYPSGHSHVYKGKREKGVRTVRTIYLDDAARR